MDENETSYLTEAEAWLEIARRIEAGKWQMEGLCREAEVLLDSGLITGAVDMDMADRIQDSLETLNAASRGPQDKWITYLYPKGVAAPRIDLCRLFAKDAEKAADLLAGVESAA